MQYEHAHTLMLAEQEVFHFDMTTYEYEMIDRSLVPHAISRASGNLVYALRTWLQERAIQVNRSNKDKILKACGMSGAYDILTLITRYRALSLLDNYWIKGYDEDVRYADVNLYENSFSRAMYSVALYGAEGITIQGATPEINQRGTMAKAYKRTNGGIYLYKTGIADKIRTELFASKVAQYCGMSSVEYHNVHTKHSNCVRCRLETSTQIGWIPAKDITNSGRNPVELAKELSPQRYHEMRIFDYIAGNTDRHNENWAFEVNNRNRILGLSRMYDFDNCFCADDTTTSHIDLKPLKKAALQSFPVIGDAQYFTRLKGFLRSCRQRDLAAYVLERVRILEQSIS